MSGSKRFYIVNDVDRPYESHVVEKISGNMGVYIHPTLCNWNKKHGNFTINPECTDVRDFGFSIKANKDKVIFERVGPSIATYKDGKKREWQGLDYFTMISYAVPGLIIDKKTVWRCEIVPEVTIENHGNHVYDIVVKGDILGNYVFTNYKTDKDEVVKEWFDEEITRRENEHRCSGD